jgi:hypothetical protein
MSKRKRFISTSILLSIGFIIIQLLPERSRFLSIGTLGVLTILLFVWSLRESLGFNVTILTLILPVSFTTGVGLFWFLLPSSIFTRIPINILYGIGVYALCLTANIYTVSAIRTIALFRAARGVGFVLSLLTYFLIFDTILSFRWPLYIAAAGIFIICLFLYLQAFWSVTLDKYITREVLFLSVVSSLVTAEISLALFFWPTTVVVGSLFLTVSVYVLMGLGQANLDRRLFGQTVREYLLLAILVFFGMLLATSWSG